MESARDFGDLHVELGADHVALAEIRRPPNNFFDLALIASLADALESLDAALVLAPDDVQATRALFEAQLRSGDNLAAARLAERTMERRPEHPLGHFLLAVVMERDGADEDADAEMENDPAESEDQFRSCGCRHHRRR